MITIKTNLHIIDYLHVTINLSDTAILSIHVADRMQIYYYI